MVRPQTLNPYFALEIPDASRVLLSSNVRVSLRIASRPSDAAVVVGLLPGLPCRPDATEWSLMKPGIHPDYHALTVHCPSGHPFQPRPTLKPELLRVQTSSN